MGSGASKQDAAQPAPTPTPPPPPPTPRAVAKFIQENNLAAFEGIIATLCNDIGATRVEQLHDVTKEELADEGWKLLQQNRFLQAVAGHSGQGGTVSTTRRGTIANDGTLEQPTCLANEFLNKGTAYTDSERETLKLSGLLPPVVETLEMQVKREWAILQLLDTPILKYRHVMSLAAINVRLFYALLASYIVQLLPIIYTPTVGEACQKFSQIHSSYSGLFIPITARGNIAKLLDNWEEEPDICVVTDGGRILGLGDLGVGGHGIPMGKCNLYVAGGGFNPSRALPITVDVGCDTPEVLNSGFYLGLQRPRAVGEEHETFMDELMVALSTKWPKLIIQFEDFQTPLALKYLNKYRDTYRHFNDDVQGTAAVVVAGFINGMKAQGTPLSEARVVMYGAGSSSLGVSQYLIDAMVLAGVPKDAAKASVYMVDRKGLITTTRGDDLNEFKKPFARTDGTPDMNNLLGIIKFVKPNAVFGLSGSGPTFTEEMIRALVDGVEGKKPLLFPLSNPTSKAEISFDDALKWTDGHVLFASGSPFPPALMNGETRRCSQCNNMLIFPGVGQGTRLSGATRVTDSMLLVGAYTVANAVSEAELANGQLYPPLTKLREIGKLIARATWKKAVEEGVATVPLPSRPEDVTAAVNSGFYDATY